MSEITHFEFSMIDRCRYLVEQLIQTEQQLTKYNNDQALKHSNTAGLYTTPDGVDYEYRVSINKI